MTGDRMIQVGVNLPGDLIRRIDERVCKECEGRPSRAAFIRQVMERAVDRPLPNGLVPPPGSGREAIVMGVPRGLLQRFDESVKVKRRNPPRGVLMRDLSRSEQLRRYLEEALASPAAE
jgi:metal-responsive CopG/Arc/MetJ family transcriptional regulator